MSNKPFEPVTMLVSAAVLTVAFGWWAVPTILGMFVGWMLMAVAAGFAAWAIVALLTRIVALFRRR